MAQGNSSNANRYKGEDIDEDGDGSVNDAQTLQGNQPDDLKGMSAQENETLLSVIADTVENKYANGLNADSFESIQTDAFVDQSQIASKSNIDITTGTSGNIKLKKTVKTLNTPNEDFTGNFGDAPSGLKIETKNSISELKVTLMASNGGNADILEVQNADGTSTLHSKDISSVTNGETVTISVSLSSNTKYRVIIDDPGSDYDYSGSNTNPPSNGTNLDVVKGIDSGTETSNYHYVFTEIQSTSISKNGYIISTTKNLSYTPSAVVPDQTASIGSGEDIVFTARDSSGNTKTLTIGERNSLDFADGDVSVKIEATGDGSSTPTLEDYGVDWKK